MKIENFDYLFDSYMNEFNSSSELSEDELTIAIRNTKRLLVPNFKFMNLYKTDRLPRYELKLIKYDQSENLRYIEGLNFSIDDGLNILLEPIRVFLEKNKIYVGHLPSGLESEVSEFIIFYLSGINEVIDKVFNRYRCDYFSWDKFKRFKIPKKNRELDFCSKEIILYKDSFYNKFYPEFSDKPTKESISFYVLFKCVIQDYFIKYLNEDLL